MPSKRVIDSPYELDFDIATLNFRASVLTREASIWSDLVKLLPMLRPGANSLTVLVRTGCHPKHIHSPCYDSILTTAVGHCKRPQSACSILDGILERTVRVRRFVKGVQLIQRAVCNLMVEPLASNTREFSSWSRHQSISIGYMYIWYWLLRQVSQSWNIL